MAWILSRLFHYIRCCCVPDRGRASGEAPAPRSCRRNMGTPDIPRGGMVRSSIWIQSDRIRVYGVDMGEEYDGDAPPVLHTVHHDGGHPHRGIDVQTTKI